MCYPISRCPAPRSSSSCSICTSKQVKFLEIHRSPSNHCFHCASIVEPSTEVLRPSSAHSVLKMTRRRRRRCPQQIFEPQQFDGGNVQSFSRELGKMWAPCQTLLAKFCHKSHWKGIKSMAAWPAPNSKALRSQGNTLQGKLVDQNLQHLRWSKIWCVLCK